MKLQLLKENFDKFLKTETSFHSSAPNNLFHRARYRDSVPGNFLKLHGFKMGIMKNVDVDDYELWNPKFVNNESEEPTVVDVKYTVDGDAGEIDSVIEKKTNEDILHKLNEFRLEELIKIHMDAISEEAAISNAGWAAELRGKGGRV